MSSYRFDRADYYAQLHRHDECLAEAIVQRRRAHAPYSSHLDYWNWPAGARLGERAYRVRDAVAASEAIALRELEAKLSGIGLADIWPVLREICHDVALYVGGGVLAGSVIGAGVGMLVFGAGILPGATAGALVGAQAGNLLLGFFGLKSVVGFMADSLPRAAHAYQAGFREAWGRMPDLGINSFDAPHFGADFQPGSTYHAARDFARGHEILVIALLAGMAAYLTRGKGQLPALLAEVRQSARLGPKMAGWLEQNADRLVRQPLLQERGKGTGNGAIGADTAGQAPSSRPRKAGKSTAPAETAGKVLRESEQLIGKTEGGPGSWQLSPKRTGGEAYQEQITGVRRGIEYDVPSDRVPSGKVRFNGFDAERKVLLDAKDWKGYPPKDTEFWKGDLLDQAENQTKAARGTPIEWHFSSPEGMQAVKQLFKDEEVAGIRLVLTPNH